MKLVKKNSKSKAEKPKLSLEESLWETAEQLRGTVEVSQYKYIALGLMFLKFISDRFEERKKEITDSAKSVSAEVFLVEDKDSYTEKGVFYLNKGSRWSDLMKAATQKNLGIKIDKIFREIEASNPVLSGVFPQIFASSKIANENLTELVNMFSKIGFGTKAKLDVDSFGRAYEFFIKKFAIRVPPLQEQIEIASFLVKIDTEIEFLNNENDILENIVKSTFQSWFVNFDGQTEFVDSELGKIPKGWKVVQLLEITSVITKGTTPTQNEINSNSENVGKVNYVRVKDITEEGGILYSKIRKIPESIHKNSLKRSVLQNNDILYTIAGTIGRIALVDHDLLPANTNQAIAIIRPAINIPHNFIELIMRQKEFYEELHSKIVHAVQQNLSLGVLSNSKLILPPKKFMNNVFTPIEFLKELVRVNLREQNRISSIQDLLLPKLISGEIRV